MISEKIFFCQQALLVFPTRLYCRSSLNSGSFATSFFSSSLQPASTAGARDRSGCDDLN
jgi:hypothetical protein